MGVPGGGDDDDLVRPQLARRRGDASRVLARGARGSVEDDPGSRGRVAHQLGLPGEENGVVVPRERLGVPQPCEADRVQVAPAETRVAEHGDEPHQRRRLRNVSSVPTTVKTTSRAFQPRSFDSPPARSRISTGTSSTRSPSSLSRNRASTSGASVAYGRASTGSALALTAYMPLVASRNGRRRRTRIERRSSAVPNRRAPDGL